MGASNCATMSSSKARVESATGRIWFRPNEGGSWRRGKLGWRVLWEVVGRGAGLRRVRETGLLDGCFEGGGRGGSEPDEEVMDSVESGRIEVGDNRMCRGIVESGVVCVRVTREVAASIVVVDEY